MTLKIGNVFSEKISALAQLFKRLETVFLRKTIFQIFKKQNIFKKVSFLKINT